MAKELLPYKVIIELNADGTFKTALYQYKVVIDGVTQRQFNTITIDEGITKNNINAVLSLAKDFVKRGEKL